jgi:hypothetical protein
MRISTSVSHPLHLWRWGALGTRFCLWRDSSWNLMWLSYYIVTPKKIENQFVDILGLDFTRFHLFGGCYHGLIYRYTPKLPTELLFVQHRGANEPLIPLMFCGRTCTSRIGKGWSFSRWDPKSKDCRGFSEQAAISFGLTWAHMDWLTAVPLPRSWCLLPWRICGRIGVCFQASAIRMRVASTSDLHVGPGDPRLGLLWTQHHHSGRG